MWRSMVAEGPQYDSEAAYGARLIANLFLKLFFNAEHKSCY